jgi:hypothetical protein|tara:strand:- start:2361 stop:3509 length:1149 start_codon:yes stop_codon:yes gene_type:complete
MSRILKRPMFRRGGKVNEGIMSGLVDRKNYKFGSMTEDQIRSNIDMLTNLQNQFSPVAKTRLPLGDVGLALIAGQSPIDALATGYKKFTSEDDKRRALLNKRKSAAVSTVLGQALKPSKDSRTDLEKKLEAAGYLKGSPEFQAAMATLLFKDVRPKAGFRTLTEAEAKQKLGSAYEEGKAYQIDTDPRSSNFNKVFVIGGGGTTIQNILPGDQIQGSAARDKIINQTNFVERQLKNLDTIESLLKEDPTLGGGVGFIRKFAFDTLSLGKDLNIDLSGPITQLGGEELLLNTNTARLEALEDILVPAFARVMNPNTRITNQMLNEAKSAINLTGLKGSDAIRTKLKEIRGQFQTYINDQNALLGKTLTQPKKFKVVDGKLVEQ